MIMDAKTIKKMSKEGKLHRIVCSKGVGLTKNCHICNRDDEKVILEQNLIFEEILKEKKENKV